MENSSQQDAEEIVAAGELFKQSTSGSKTWALRKFVLAGVYLIYFNRKGERKGQWSIMGCQVKRMTPEEVGTPAAKNAFALVGPKTTHVLCASSDKNRVAWINLISEQIIEFKDILRRFLNTGESIVGNSQVRKKGLFGFSSNMRVLLTNLPRLIVIDQTAEVLNDQMSWDKQCPPTFTRLGENRFKVQLERKEFTFEDADNGAKYWEEVFRRLPVMNYFVPKRRASMVVDFQDREGGDYFTERVRLDSLIDGAEPSGKNRRMTAGAADEAGNNVRFLQDALSNINELVRALEEKISEIDETNAAAEKAGGLDDMSRQLRDDRKQKRSQLLMLKDNVAVLSTNLQTLVTRSTEDGTTNFDVDAIESVISETAAMLVMLSRETEVGNYDPASEPIEPLEIEEPKVALEVELKKIDEFVAKVDEESTAVNKMVASIEFTGDDKDDLIEEMIATFDGIDVSEDIPITPSNFDAGDPIKRPSNWKDIRMKRILIKELVSRLEGIPEKAITDTRKAKVLEEEAIMTEEVVSNGRLLNMESLRNWKSLLQAAVAVTPDNYAEKDKTKRPLAWQAIRFKRVVQREEIARRERGTSEAAILKGRTNKIIREEKLMKREVAAHGQILHFGGLDLENIVVQDLDQSPTYTASKIANRAKGWVLLRLKRVMIVEALERKAGKDEKTINEEQASKIVAEDALMLAESTQYGVALSIDEDFKFVTPKSSVWGEVALRRVMLRAEFLKLTTLRPAQLAAERKLMDNEILRYQQLLYVHLWKGGHNINVAQLKATADNFVPEDPAKRPEGWSDLKERRKYILEKAKKDDGMDEETIESMRPEKTADEEESMIAEVKEWLGLTAPAARDAAKDRKEITSNDTKASTFADLVITPETFDPKDPSKRPDGWVAVRMMRVIVKEQAERVKGVDEETIMESRTKREEEEEATMIGEVVANNAVLGFNKDVTKAGPKLHVEVSRINYEPWNLAKRPPNWLNLRLKRVMLREHIERIGGVNEDVTASQRAEKEFEEEIAMMDEVAFTGRVLGVGEVSRIKPTPDTLPMIQLTASTFDPANALARPKEWKDLLKTRVFVKDQFDMVNGVKEAELAANRAQREADEEEIMITEAQSVNKICLLVAGTHLMVKPQPKDAARESWRSVGLIKFDPTNFDPANPNKRPTGWNSVRRKRVLKKEQLERLRGTKEEEIEAKHDERGLEEEQHMLREVALYGCLVGIGGLKASQVKGKFDSLRNVEDILEVTDENFDPSDASKRPKGWATVKLRRVYLKEWKDRKDGVDDNTIFARRYQREQEAENEMVQEMSVAGRIKRFERLVAMNQSKALLPSGALKHEPQKATSVDAKMQMEKSAVLGNFIKAANQTLETLSEKVSDTLTEKALSPNRAQQTGPSNAAFKLKKNINTQPTAPRVIDTGRGPRGPRPGHSVSVTSAFKDLKTRKGPASVSELGINSNNYDPSNPLKRPAGWADLRARRVEELESKDRSYGLDETIIAQMRTERLAAEEDKMMEEADVVERVSFMESNTSKPTSTFFANLAGSRLSFTGKK